MTVRFCETYWGGYRKKGAATQILEIIKGIPGTVGILWTARETGEVSLGGHQEGRGIWGRTTRGGCEPAGPHVPHTASFRLFRCGRHSLKWLGWTKTFGLKHRAVTDLLRGWAGEQKRSATEQRGSGSEHVRGPQRERRGRVMVLWNMLLEITGEEAVSQFFQYYIYFFFFFFKDFSSYLFKVVLGFF